MVDALATPDALKNCGLLVELVRRNQNHDRFADHLFGGVAEDAFRPAVPAGDDAVEVLAHDRVIRVFDDRGEPLRVLLGALAITDLHQHIDGTHERTRAIVEKGRIGNERRPCAIGPFRHHLHAPYRSFFLERQCHRALIVRHGTAVRPIEAPRSAPLFVMEVGMAAPEVDGRLVVVGDAPFGIRCVDRRGKRLEQIVRPVQLGGVGAVAVGAGAIRFGGRGRYDPGRPAQFIEGAAQELRGSSAQRRVAAASEKQLHVASRKYFHCERHAAAFLVDPTVKETLTTQDPTGPDVNENYSACSCIVVALSCYDLQVINARPVSYCYHVGQGAMTVKCCSIVISSRADMCALDSLLVNT